jgi:hypothetical protein
MHTIHSIKAARNKHHSWLGLRSRIADAAPAYTRCFDAASLIVILIVVIVRTARDLARTPVVLVIRVRVIVAARDLAAGRLVLVLILVLGEARRWLGAALPDLGLRLGLLVDLVTGVDPAVLLANEAHATAQLEAV